MKKNIFLTLALALTFVGTAWGQSTDQPFKVESVTYASGYPFVYDGTAKTYITDFSSNCSLNKGLLTGNTATNAGSYTATISSQCYGHPISTYEEFHVGSVTYNWSILPRDISKTDYTDYNVTITVNDKKWTGSEINISAVYTIKFKGADLTAADYDVYVTKGETPTTIKDEGRYTIVFTGKGNFTGTITRTFDVKKDLNAAEALTGIHFDIPTQLITTADYDFATVVTDKKSHTTLYEGTDFELHFFATETNAEAYVTAADAAAETTALAEEKTEAEIKTAGEGKYYVVAKGLAPKYEGKVSKAFYVVNEYQTFTATDGTANISLHITEPGYPVAETSPTGVVVIGKMMVGAKAAAAVDAAAERVKIPATHTVSVTDDITFDIAGIEDGAFKGCNTLRYIDATNLEGYTPSSLDRKAENTPFEGLPKQTLVFLEGATVTGENYIYKTTTAGDYRCETLMIYDDVNGTQTGFENANAAMWGFMNPIEFKANTVTNTRILTAKEVTNTVTYTNVKQQAYTTCLPYELPLPKGLKAYALAYSKTNQIGFTEVTANTLTAMTPYLIIPSSSGQMLSTTNADIKKTYEATNDPATCKYVDITPTTSQATGTETKYDLKGTMAYLSGADGMYIMQSNNVWAAVSGASDYPNPCVLPMRAYIEAYVAPARLYTVFNNADGSTTGIANLQIDADTQAEVYDLQGRKVAAPQRGGLYIVNGKKMLMK